MDPRKLKNTLLSFHFKNYLTLSMSGEQRTNINPHCKKMKIPFVYRMPLMKPGFFLVCLNVLLFIHSRKKMSEIFLLNNHCQQPPVKIIIIMDKPSK